MAKKRKNFKKKYRQASRRHGKSRPLLESSRSLAKSILTYAYKLGNPFSINQIFNDLDHDKKNKREIGEEIISLVKNGDLTAAGKKRFRLNNKGNIFEGKLEKNAKGFGFVTELRPRESAARLKRDPFLSVKHIGTANHGDQILIKILQVRKDNRPEAEIISILKRGSETVSGFFKKGNPPIVIPEDPRYPSIIHITETPEEQIDEDDVVLVQIQPHPGGYGPPCGAIKEVLGPAQNIDVQMRIVIENHNLPYVFPDAAEKEAKKLAFDEKDLEDRLDLRNTCHVTIDGETAKDFDDAVAVEKTGKGYRLYVSIADVSHFVKPGSPLDKEAYARGTSVYFPGRVIPMLPEELSNHLCSLVPHQDRLTFTAILDFDKSGNLSDTKFAKSVICSKHRFTYTTVKEILLDRNEETVSRHKDFLTPLKWAKQLAEALFSARMARGSIGFNIPEPEVSLKDDGNIKSITRKERNFAHQIIEEFMLAANEAVAGLFTKNKRELLYRIHEKPATLKVEEFTSFAKTLSIEIPEAGPEPDPSWFAKVLAIVKGKPTEYVVNNLLLRTMQQARYDSDNQGHFGLAAADYTHFTSPIRRYPDLLVHRFLHDFLQKYEAPSMQQPALKEKGQHLSSRERLAITAERDINDRLKVFFMKRYIGETFKAVISGIIDTAFFVELTDLFISGAVDIEALTDDYYLFDIKRYRFIGEISGKTYQLGDEIEVMLLSIDERRKRINFAPAGNQQR